jgi:importin subunit beta-1
MRKDEPDAGVRLAATTALGNALEFAATNFEAEPERNYIMQTVCEGCAAPDARVRVASFECLVRVAAAHYDLLPAYMAELFALTVRAVREDGEDVAKLRVSNAKPLPPSLPPSLPQKFSPFSLPLP